MQEALRCQRDLPLKSTAADGLVRYEPNQTTFNTAFLLFVLSRVEVFGPRTALRRCCRLFFLYGFDPIDIHEYFYSTEFSLGIE